ncbi:phage/plasmid-like protein TIGR03299 [Aquitalea magnusonii]|nr:phage/plasmid-like protein TIGR03299 [Aquitalea magnusonii]
MSHLIESMAFVGATPWHGLGNPLSPQQPLDVWLTEAGMDWRIEQSDVLFNVADDGMHIRPFADSKVLYRSDSLAPLSVVSPRYKVVQPSEVLEFYRDLVSAGGFELETAGVLKGGRKLWALAKTGQEALLKGGDRVKAYLLLATSCDGTLCTTAQFTSVRVVCNNTLQMAVKDRTGAVKVPHSTVFDPQSVKEALGLGLSAWDRFIGNIKQLSQRTVSPEEASQFFREVLDEPLVESGEDAVTSKALQQVSALYSGGGMGSLLAGTKGTAWGLVNAMTEYVDHRRRARSQDYRLDSAWFGQGAQLKGKALEHALALVE